MRHLAYTLLACLVAVPLAAQRVSHVYNNVPLGEALLQLSSEQTAYAINFLYNELEDFRITTTVSRKPLPDAIRQMVGFYPIRVTVDADDREIYVECIHKTDRHLTGTIIDEHDQPIAYANVAVFNPADSTVLAGGVSNESGYFAIPYGLPPAPSNWRGSDAAAAEASPSRGRLEGAVLARVSCVGYKTVFRLCDQDDVGLISLRPETYTIHGVQVRGERSIVKAENGHLIYNMPQLLELLPADNAYEALTRIPGVLDTEGSLMFAGQTVTLIINGKPTTLGAEQMVERLRQMPATMLAKAEVMASAPARYHVHGTAINVVTKDFAGTRQQAGQLLGTVRQSKYAGGSVKGTLLVQRGQLGLDASYSLGGGDTYDQVEHEAHHPLGQERVDYADHTERRTSVLTHSCRVGLDYAFAKDSRLNVAYTGRWSRNDQTNTSTGLETAVQQALTHTRLHNVDASYTAPFGLQLSASFTSYQTPRTQQLDGRLYDAVRRLSVDSRQRISKWLVSADQTHTLGGGWELYYGVEAQLTSNESHQTTLGADGQPLADATSRADYDERILDLYAGFGKRLSTTVSLDASLGAQHYHTPKWDEWRCYPTLNALWNASKRSTLSLAFSSEAVFPPYWRTMSSVFYSSAYSEIWGNPDLKPNPVYVGTLTWQLRQRYTLAASVRHIPDYSVQMAYQPSDRLAVIMKETNFNYLDVYGLQASARFAAGRWLNGTATATANYRHDKSDRFFDLPFDRRQLTVVLSSTTSLRLMQRHDVRLVLTPTFQSKAIQGVYDIDPMFRLGASLRWTSANKAWSLVAAGQNITNSHATTRSRLANQDYTMRVWVQYPTVSLTAVCRLGGFKEKKTKAVDTSRMGY